MKLSSVILSTSPDGEQIKFSVREQDPRYRYLLRAMVGVDAENIVPKYYATGLVSQKPYYQYSMTPREIVMRVVLNPLYSVNEDVSELRDAVYKLISSSRTGEITLHFESGGSVVCGITGRIIKMEVPHFSREPELQVTVRCDDPVFRALNPIVIPSAEFPSTNPLQLVDDSTTAPHGFVIKVEFTATTTRLDIQDDPTTPDWRFMVLPSTSFLTGDTLYISSEYGKKRVYWDKASGTDIELMDKIVAGSVWPEIFPGLNTFYIPQIANIDILEIQYTSAYWGL